MKYNLGLSQKIIVEGKNKKSLATVIHIRNSYNKKWAMKKKRKCRSSILYIIPKKSQIYIMFLTQLTGI